MYPEFVPIYIGLIVIIALLLIILFLVVLVLKRLHNGKRFSAPKNFSGNNLASAEAASIVFCKNCATQFDYNEKCCPKCGMPR